MNLPIGLKTSLRRNVELSKFTTMQVGGAAEYFAEPNTEDELQELLDFARQEKIPFMILGKGSNVIFSDEGFKGLVITTIHMDQNLADFDPDGIHVTVSAGIHLYRFTLLCRDRGLGGAEFLCSIPGTIGGALRMNAGFSRFKGQRNEIGDIVELVNGLDMQGNKVGLSKNDLQFSYRWSNLSDYTITSARFRLWRRHREDIEREIRANFRYRSKEQDVRYPSSGSIFKNPKSGGRSAGQIIDSLGLKGTRIGGAMISEQHANYMINAGNAKSSDFAELIKMIQEKVLNATGIWLEPEVLLV